MERGRGASVRERKVCAQTPQGIEKRVQGSLLGSETQVCTGQRSLLATGGTAPDATIILLKSEEEGEPSTKQYIGTNPGTEELGIKWQSTSGGPEFNPQYCQNQKTPVWIIFIFIPMPI
jgi:hypothetical protein